MRRPIPPNIRPIRHRVNHTRDAGGAAPWLILVAVVLAVLGGIALWGPKRGGPDRSAPVETQPAPAAAVTAELTELGDLFGQVTDNNRGVQPLIDRIDALIASHPEQSAAHILRGQMLLHAGRPDQALEAFQASLKLQPRQANVHRLAGNLAMQLQKYDDARHHYEQARSIEPGNGEHAVYLANLQLKIGEDDQAVKTLLTAIRLDSQRHEAYALLSDIYARQNKVGLALGQIERAIQTASAQSPGPRTAYVLKRAKLLRRDNQPGESLAALQALPQDARLEPLVMRDIATSWMMLGKPQRAAEQYELALRLDPSSDLAAAEAARWRLKAGDVETARKHVQTLRRINPRYEAIPKLEQALREADDESGEP